MSALGQKQTYAVQNGMSALPPKATAKADISPWVMSALHPKADMCSATSACPLWANSGHCGQALPSAFFAYAARSTRVVISLRSAPKSMGLVKSASAPPSNALRLVSTSP